jgi:glycosyltransferase involved in cell wall biosynthesis
MNNHNIKISIIIPVYNEDKSILKVLNRINETSDNDLKFEVIVINDGSTDDTLNILKKNETLYDQLITYEKNSGKGNAVKKVLKHQKVSLYFFKMLI